MSSIESWAYLSRAIEGPSVHLQALLRAGRDADEIAHGVRTRASWLGGLTRQTEARYATNRAVADLEEAQKHGYTLLTPDSAGWPTAALQTSFGALESISTDAECPPHALWVRGNRDLPGLFERSVGVVGTRAATAYGHQATANVVDGLGGHRYTVISGGAMGIDTVAHDAALAASTPTVAIGACGTGVSYPRRNERLFERIAEQGGSLVTEYPPGVTPDRHRFLTRNRLIAAFSTGTLIVEAAFRSGALNTLKWANAFGRQTMSVPGPITSPESLGTNLAIVNRQATMVLSADHIHELLSKVGHVDAQLALEFEHAPTPLQQLSHNELRVYDSLPPVGEGGREAERVAEVAGMSVGLTVHLLLDLQKRNLVQREGRQWKRTVERAGEKGEAHL